MANDITEFTNLKNLFKKVQTDPYYKLSEQNIKGLRGWSPTEIQALENIKKQMSDEAFHQIKDINGFDFKKYLNSETKPAVNSTVPETKPAVNSTVPETKPAVNSTVPETKPGSSKLPSAEDVGIKQAGKLKSILNGINPFYVFTEAAARQSMYDKAIADAKKAGYRNGEIPKEVKDKILGIKNAKITTGAKIKHGLLPSLKSGPIVGATVGYVTDALSPKDTGADEMQNIYGGWGTTGKYAGYASYFIPRVGPAKIALDIGDASLHKLIGENDEAGAGGFLGGARDIVHLGSKWDELGNMLRRSGDEYSNWFSGKGMRDDPATVRDDIRALSQRAASYPAMPQDYIDTHRLTDPTQFTSGIPSKPLNGIDYKRDIDTSKFISPYQVPGNISKQQMQDGYLTLTDQIRRRGINKEGFTRDFIHYLANVDPEALGKSDYHNTNLTKSSYLFGKDGEQVYTTPYMINKDAVQAFFNDPRVKASGRYSDAEIADILSKMNDDAIQYD